MSNQTEATKRYKEKHPEVYKATQRRWRQSPAGRKQKRRVMNTYRDTERGYLSSRWYNLKANHPDNTFADRKEFIAYVLKNFSVGLRGRRIIAINSHSPIGPGNIDTELI